jgi:cysteine-rich repeat protein
VTMHRGRPRPVLVAAGCLALLAVAPRPARAAILTVVNADGAGEGFNDATPVAPVGGNPGTTLGAQRLNAFRFAADIWGGSLVSSVEIRINATFDPLPCNSSFAVLGAAGARTAAHDFSGAPVASTWYPIALANALAGTDLDPGNDDIDATFSSSVGTTCTSFDWYYGYDANPPGSATDFIAVVLHELGHGLGFASLVDDSTGQRLLGRDDAFMLKLEDHSTGKTWGMMTDGERKASAIDTGDLHWVGASVVANGGFLTAGRDPVSGHVQMYAPDPLQPGSSVSHWDTALTPDEILEPAYTGPDHDPYLAIEALKDVGWAVAHCGNGVVEGAEGCDDGNTTGGDGCSSTCRVESCHVCSGEPSVCTVVGDGTPCDDGNACTQTDTCVGGACVGSNPLVCTPLDQCHVAGTCSPSTGCSNPNRPDGTPCDDGDGCTAPDECTGGVCAGLPNCIDPFLCYKARTSAGAAKFAPVPSVSLVDDFENLTVDVTKVKRLCTPADENGQGIIDPATHLENYQIVPVSGSARHVPRRNLLVTNQLGQVTVDTVKVDFLLVPTAKDPTTDPPPPGPNQVDHYKCYKVKISHGATRFPKGVSVMLADQFISPAKSFTVVRPTDLCTPVDENGSGVKHAAVNQLCYKVKPAVAGARHLGLHVNNEFGIGLLDASKEDLLCLPSLRQP